MKIKFSIALMVVCLMSCASPSFAGSSSDSTSGAIANIGIGSVSSREFGMPVGAPQFSPGSGIFMGPYQKQGDWNALLPDFLLLKDTWTKEDFQRVTDKTSPKGGVELIPLNKINPEGTSIVRVIYDSKITLKEIREGYYAYAALTIYAGTKKEISYAALVLKAMEVNFEEVGAPVVIIADIGDRLGSKTYGWTAGIGVSMNAMQPGAGNYGGNASTGFAVGSLNSTQSDNPYVRVYLVAPLAKVRK